MLGLSYLSRIVCHHRTCAPPNHCRNKFGPRSTLAYIKRTILPNWMEWQKSICCERPSSGYPDCGCCSLTSCLDLGIRWLRLVISCVCHWHTTTYSRHSWHNPQINNHQTWPWPLHAYSCSYELHSLS